MYSLLSIGLYRRSFTTDFFISVTKMIDRWIHRRNRRGIRVPQFFYSQGYSTPTFSSVNFCLFDYLQRRNVKIRKFRVRKPMHQGLNFGVRNALKLTYEHVTVRKNFPGATPPGPPGGGRGGEGRGMGEGKAEGGGGRGMGEYGEGEGRGKDTDLRISPTLHFFLKSRPGV
jgi:hypothetical protein